MQRRDALGALLGLPGAVMQAGAQPRGGPVALPTDAAPAFSWDTLPALPRRAAECWSFARTGHEAFDAVEWQVRLSLPADGKSPLFEQPNSADFVVRFPRDASLTLHAARGSHAEPSDFQPLEAALARARPVLMESYGGRSSDGFLPYFNLASIEGGLVVAIGWSGNWRASFEAIGDGGVRVIAGLKRARFRLRQGGSLRLPGIVLMRYRGNWLDGQNRFRRLMRHAFSPTSHGAMRMLPVAASVHGMLAFNDTTEQKLTALAADIGTTNLPVDTFWLDAGWNEGGFPGAQGNPDADRVRFPRGLAPVGEAARRAGLRFLAWFEPERAMRGTWLERRHPDWLLRPVKTPPSLRYQETDGFLLLDLGNPEARAWALDDISRHIREAGISVYRHDCNLYPEYFWQVGEDAESAGLREIRYIGGLYDFLDALARRHPGLIIDNCASGGRRLDVEMMRRSVTLWRSDNCWDDRAAYPRNVQAMTHALSLWLPMHGLGAASAEAVALRSGMGACASFAIDYRDRSAVEALRGHLARYLKVRELFMADYYPLTGWSLNPASWLAFQFHDPAAGRGIVQAFCGASTEAPAAAFRLRGLVRDATYRTANWDTPGKVETFDGAELMDRGWKVSATRGAQALVLEYSAAT